MNKNIFIVIPALNPPDELLKLVVQLQALNGTLLIVNDGSKREYDELFDSIRKYKNVEILTHRFNLGKGAALKSAFCSILQKKQSQNSIIVTADADGQHAIQDIHKIIEFAVGLKGTFLVLGVRDLSKNTPLRSKIGNLLIHLSLKIFHGIDCKGDSQTGLRAFSGDLLKKLSKLDGDKYEFETNMLISIKNEGAELELLPIKTIYIDHNKHSHFRPIIDSFKIIKQLYSYSFIAISTFFLEIFIFTYLAQEFTIIQANILARSCSITINFTLLKRYVFESEEQSLTSAAKFTAVALFNSILVGTLITFMSSKLQTNNVFIFKVIFDCLLFMTNFYISKIFIFKDKS